MDLFSRLINIHVRTDVMIYLSADVQNGTERNETKRKETTVKHNVHAPQYPIVDDSNTVQLASLATSFGS